MQEVGTSTTITRMSAGFCGNAAPRAGLVALARVGLACLLALHATFGGGIDAAPAAAAAVMPADLGNARAGATAAGAAADSTPASVPPATAAGAPTVQTIASGLVNPWSVAFLPGGRYLVTEKPGRLRIVASDGSLSAPIGGVPAVDSAGQGGLFDVAVAADYATSGRIFLSYAERGTGSEFGRNGLAVGSARLDETNASLVDWQIVYRQTPKVASMAHFGGRLVLAPGGILFITQGERFLNSERGKAQDLSQGHGKIMRLTLDGGLPRGNPFAGMRGVQQSIWTYGHRNVQGAALHPQTGELWITEHGPQGGDELNRLQPGQNYGWPLVSHGCEYGSPVGNCTPVGGASTGLGFTPPVTYWVPTSIAPSGLVFYKGPNARVWRGTVYLGALAGQALWRLKLDGNTVVEREALLTELNERIRDVREGPDGALYLLTDNSNGRLLRFMP